MLVEVQKSREKCINCNQELSDDDFVYRHKAPGGYICSNCDFFYLYESGGMREERIRSFRNSKI